MPIVPFDPRQPKARERASVSESEYLMAAAMMEEMGILKAFNFEDAPPAIFDDQPVDKGKKLEIEPRDIPEELDEVRELNTIKRLSALREGEA